MLPAIFPGAELLVGWSDMNRISAGAIVCYVGEQKGVVAHRVVRVEAQGDSTTFITRGDAQQNVQRVPVAAVCSSVEEVRYGIFFYRTAGPLGRFFARMALAEGLHWETLRRLSHYTARWVVWKIRRRQAVCPAAVR